MTAYNSYRIIPGRWNPLTPEDLQAMADADAQFEASTSAARRESRKRASTRKPQTSEQRARENAARRARYAAKKKRPADVYTIDGAKRPTNHQQYNIPSPKMQPVKRPGERRQKRGQNQSA